MRDVEALKLVSCQIEIEPHRTIRQTNPKSGLLESEPACHQLKAFNFAWSQMNILMNGALSLENHLVNMNSKSLKIARIDALEVQPVLGTQITRNREDCHLAMATSDRDGLALPPYAKFAGLTKHPPHTLIASVEFRPIYWQN